MTKLFVDSPSYTGSVKYQRIMKTTYPILFPLTVAEMDCGGRTLTSEVVFLPRQMEVHLATVSLVAGPHPPLPQGEA